MLKYLYLQNFRNYRYLEFKPDAGFLILTGANGTGKSNLLESIHYLGTGYSFRQGRDNNLMRFGSGYFLIRGIVNRKGIDYKIEVIYREDLGRKTTKINEKSASPGSCANYLPVVIFSPQDLMLVKGGPAGRRRFIDLVVGQLKPQHNNDLHYYNSVLLQRNKQLRGANTSDQQLLPWDQQLASIGGRIWKRRVSVLEQLLAYSSKIFTSLSRGRILEGEYRSKISNLETGDEIGRYQELFMESLKKARPFDKKMKATTVGPHRDDFCLSLNKREARLFASQGEQRLISLALKIGHYHLLADQPHLEPLLLLDDVFSELDEKHRIFVLESMRQDSQVIATTTTTFKEGSVEKKKLTDDIVMVYQKTF
ncbi:MAG: DNA replication/repair protein RecF [Syntrophaceticus schinkii]|jgi:DNA replication and repair protein RecF|nr:DNA replication/repair protein RecF [Syntrophaceticus schinkii]MDD4674763.1 DNA replication/repair protein RecF [Syntrophaceticus schinkii]